MRGFRIVGTLVVAFALALAIAFLLAESGCGRPADPRAPAAAEPLSDPEAVRTADVSILFVGNSHTAGHDLPGLVAAMIRFHRPGARVVTAYLPVSFLEDVARIPRCREELEQRPWKHVVLQAQKISMSGQFDYSRAEGIAYARLAKSRGAAVHFYPEWGLAGVAGDGEKQERIYREMARDAGVGVAPVAKAWDAALAERPDLTLHAADGNHQSRTGAFLTACVLFARIAGASPAELAAFPDEYVEHGDRAFLAAVAARIVAAE